MVFYNLQENIKNNYWIQELLIIKRITKKFNSVATSMKISKKMSIQIIFSFVTT